MKKNGKSLFWVLFSLVLGALVGGFTRTTFSIFGFPLYTIYDLGSKLFMNALLMIVVPLVSSSIIISLANLSNSASFKRLGGKIFLYFVSLNFIAICVGFIALNVFHPMLSASVKELVSFKEALPPVENLPKDSFSLMTMFLQVIPANVFAAFTQGQMLSIIFFSLIFGFFMTKIEDEKTFSTLLNFWKGIFQVMLKFTHALMKLLPFGVFCLMARQLAISGFDSLKSLGLFLIVILSALFFYALVAIPLLLKFIGKVSPIRYFKAVYPALITGFSTSSSTATLPVTMDCMEKRAGVSNKITSLVLPLAATLNMAGSGLYAYIAGLFLAEIYGITLTIPLMISTLFLALVASIGIAGIPSSCLVAVIVIIKSFNLPAEAIGIFLSIDRILDMCRTMVNIVTGTTSTLLVAKSEGEDHILEKESFS
jgi:Na+/H+-dicarboxylate symporter